MDEAPKESTARQLAKATATGAVGAIPGVGSPIAAILGMVLGYGYGQRLEQWRDSVTEAIAELQDKVDQSKADDPEFLDTVVAATRAVAATSRQEKLDALRNAVVNTLLPSSPEDDLRLRYIRIIDEMMPEHLQLLRFLDDPRRWYDEHPELERKSYMMASKSAIIDPAFPSLSEAKMDRLMGDLADWKIASNNYRTGMTEQGLWASSTTDLGRGLLAFIQDPASRVA